MDHTTFLNLCFPFFSLKNHSEDQDFWDLLCLLRGIACEVTDVDVGVDVQDLGHKMMHNHPQAWSC